MNGEKAEVDQGGQIGVIDESKDLSGTPKNNNEEAIIKGEEPDDLKDDTKGELNERNLLYQSINQSSK